MTAEDSAAPGTFDKRRALDELEKLHVQILEAREARRRKEAEFDAFVAGFRSGRPAPGASPATAGVAIAAPPPPKVRSEIRAASAVAAETPPKLDPVPILPTVTAVAQVVSHEVHAQPAVPDVPAEAFVAPKVTAAPSPASAKPRRNTRAAAVVIAALVIVAMVAAFFAIRARRTASPPTEAAQATSAPPPQPQATPAPPAPAPAPAAPVVTGVNLEIATKRRVWVRVTVDGVRAFEREIAADQRIPVHGEHSVVIRAGDAGAVTVTRDGGEAGALGRDGTVATKEFTAGTAPR